MFVLTTILFINDNI